MALMVYSQNGTKIEFMNGNNEQLRVHVNKSGGYTPCTLFKGQNDIMPTLANFSTYEKSIQIITNTTKRKSSSLLDIANSLMKAIENLITNGIYNQLDIGWYKVKLTNSTGSNTISLIEYIKNNGGNINSMEDMGEDAPSTETPKEEPTKDAEQVRRELIDEFGTKIMNFFSEFDYEPSNRFLDNLLYLSKINYIDCKNYIKSYFELSDSPFVNEIKEKVNSYEFNEILDLLSKINSNMPQVNKRFELYYGPAGMGKTYKAIHDYPNAPKIICRSDMSGEDLFQSFEFIDGKPHYKNSELLNSAIKGEPIILDEISLLPTECLTTLQGLLDNSTKFSFKGQEYEIKDGFKIIGTMNLIVNGQVRLLPEPLVDRASNIIEYKIPIEERLKNIWG